MHNFLDVPTLFARFTAPGEAVRATIETGGWSGIWPGHAEWNCHSEAEQLFPLAIHYFTSRHPAANAMHICTAAQVLCSNACEFFGGYPVEAEEVYQQAERWVWSLAGGIPPSADGAIGFTPPYDAAGRPMLPGGDPGRFTRAMVDIVETLVFGHETEARRQAQRFLLRAGDSQAQRAMDIFRQVALGEVIDLDAAVTCADCGASELELWYTGQTWGETLCEACYGMRSQEGKARPVDTDEV